MSTITAARVRRAASAVLVHVSCDTHETYVPRYGDAEICRHCGTVVRDETPGVAELDLALANGEIDFDLYDETLDMLLGHP
jgi:hypothetical protein